MKKKSRRSSTINDTKIKFIKVVDKLYEVERISFYDFLVEAKETDLTVDDAPEEEVFDFNYFKEFKIKLRNCHGNIVDLAEYVKNRKVKS